MSHWYDKQGNPMHWVPKKGGPGNRPTTIADARKMGLFPGVTDVIKILHKPELERWKIVQACTAVLSSPRKDGEGLDDFMNRVLFQDKEQEEEAARAADLGTAIHDAIAKSIAGKPYPEELRPYVYPVMDWITRLGAVVWSEKVLVGDGYAGKADVLIGSELGLVLTDFKSASKLPEKDSWLEHKLQTSAYAATLEPAPGTKIITANVYISTKEPGQIAMHFQDNWVATFSMGFKPLLAFWQWKMNYATTKENQ